MSKDEPGLSGKRGREVKPSPLSLLGGKSKFPSSSGLPSINQGVNRHLAANPPDLCQLRKAWTSCPVTATSLASATMYFCLESGLPRTPLSLGSLGQCLSQDSYKSQSTKEGLVAIIHINENILNYNSYKIKHIHWYNGFVYWHL